MPFKSTTKCNLASSQIEERKQQKNSFPNQISEGSFTPHSTIIEVACFRTDLVKDALAENKLMPVRRDIQVLCHEMTHWFDFFGTLWGRHYISRICNAYRAMERHSETEFNKIIELFDQDRRVLAPSYYRFSRAPKSAHSAAKPWMIEFVTGVEIDPNGNVREDKPIFMAKFGENPSGQTFARQPISVGALLEVRAIAAEIGSAISTINAHEDEGERKVEMTLASLEFNSLAYDHNLIEYNAAAHILAVQSGVSEIFLAARLAARLAYIALNLTKRDFEKLKEPDSFKVFGKRNKTFKKNWDRGYAFVCLAFNGGRFDGDEDRYIEGCLSSSNLDGSEAVLERASKALAEPIWFSNGNAATAHFFRESGMGSHILEAHCALPGYLLDLSSLLCELRYVCPPFMDADINFVELNSGRIDEYQPNEMHQASDALNKYTRNLLHGCRGV